MPFFYEIEKRDFRATLDAARGCDLVFTSPPYADARTYGNAVSWGMDEYRALLRAVYECLEPGGTFILNVDAPVREWRPGFGTERGFFPWRIMLEGADLGFRVPDRLAYVRHGQVGKYRGRFRNDWEPLLWFEKPGGSPWFECPTDPVTTGNKSGGQTVDGTWTPSVRDYQGLPQDRKYRGTVWRYSSGANDFKPLVALKHPARFTLALAEDVVRCFAPPGGVVCDPFTGSGTTALACKRHGRHFVGGDLFDAPNGEPWARVATRILETVE